MKTQNVPRIKRYVISGKTYYAPIVIPFTKKEIEKEKISTTQYVRAFCKDNGLVNSDGA